jgi:hypothetical protein
MTVVGSIDSEMLLSEKLADFLWSTPFDWIFDYHMVAFSQWSDIFSGTFFTRFIVTVQPIWERKYRAWTCSVVEILGLNSILGWHWTTQQVPNAEQRPLNISEYLGLYLVFKRLKHKSLLRCKASHSHVFSPPHGWWFRAIKAFF